MSYRVEIDFHGSLYHSKVRETPELAAGDVARLLGSPHWQERLSRAGASCSVRLVAVDRAAVAHPLADASIEGYSETLRRRLYDQAVADYFTPELEPDEEEESPAARPYSPDVARLKVFYLHGRWLVAWRRLECEHVAEEDRNELLRIYMTERGVVYHEV